MTVNKNELYTLPEKPYTESLLDDMLGESRLVIIGSRPGMGKTTVALDLLRDSAILSGKTALFFSLELSLAELRGRLLAAQTNIDLDKIVNGGLSAAEQTDLWEAGEELKNANIVVQDVREPSLELLRERCLSQKNTPEGLDIVFVDYLQLMSASKGVSADRREAVRTLSDGLKLLADELERPVVVLSQLNRDVVKRSDKTPVLTDLSASSSLEQNADMIIFVHRPDQYDEDNLSGRSLVFVAKNRTGNLGAFVRPKHGYSVDS